MIIVPIALIVLFNLPIGKCARRCAFWAAIFVCAAQCALVLFPDNPFWRAPLEPFTSWFSSPPIIDSISLVMLLSIAVVSTVATLVARYSIADEESGFNFVNMIFAALAGMNGVVLMTDLFSLYVFIEIAAVASFVLIAFEHERDAFEGAFKYIVLSAVATMLILSGIALLFIIAGGVSFASVHAALYGKMTSPFAIAATAIFMVGLFIKGGLVPFHGWLPDAYSSAPAPVSVLLAGVITKTVGIYALLRLVVSVFGFTPHVQYLLMAIGLIERISNPRIVFSPPSSVY